MALRRNILLFHQGALGDFVLTWPLALGLARVFAQSRVFYVTGGQKGALAEKALRVEAVDSEAAWHHLFSEDPRLPEPAARLLHGAQWIITFLSNDQGLWAKNVRAMAPDAGLVTLGTQPPAGFSGHITEHLVSQLKPWPVIEVTMGQMLRSVAARGIGTSAPARDVIVVHPGAGSAGKCWPPQSFGRLVCQLREMGRNVEVILGEVELERWPRERIEEFAGIAQVRRPATLVELMHVIAGASAFIGNDSGPGHLAGVLGVPTVSVFGPGDPTRWRPLGPRVRVIKGEFTEISVDQVIGAIGRSMDA